jgi:hypothetical protein
MSKKTNKLSRNKVYVEEVFKFLEENDYELYVSNSRDFGYLFALEVLVGKPLNLVFL